MVEVGAIFLSLAGATAGGLLKKAAERHVEKAFQGSIEGLAKLGKKKPMVQAMEIAWKLTLDTVLKQVQALGGYEDDDPELKEGAKALCRFLDNDHVGAELLKAVLDPDDKDAMDAAVLSASWNILDGPELPAAFTWDGVIQTYRARLPKVLPKIEGLQDELNSKNLIAIRKLLEGVAPRGNEAKYGRTVRERYRVLDLSALREDSQEKRTLFEVQTVFVPQQIRLDPPPLEIPRDVLAKLAEEGVELPEEEDEELARLMQEARAAMAQHPPDPVLETLTDPANKHVVLIGGPGSGKSTLTRYLLLSTLDEPGHGADDWVKAYRGHLPLLLELREFQLAYADKRCKTFLDYWHHLGETESYHLDRQWLHERLSSGPSLVLFDGLDEIFKIKERQRVMRAIAGFARDYPAARVVVTSRPIGYPEEILRTASFRHYGIEELDEKRIHKFVNGWFRLVFPSDTKARGLRIQRIIDAMDRPSVRQLAGNPMLLTIMAVIAERQALPNERWEFFQYAADTLSHHWEVSKELEEAVLPEGFGLSEKKELLSRIAFRLQGGKGGLAGNLISEKALEDEVSSYLQQRYGLETDRSLGFARGLIDKLRRRNYILCLRGSAVYGFVRRTFLEYFCARWWVERLQNDPDFSIEDLWTEVFAKHWPEAEWNEVLRLICGIVGEKHSRVLLQNLLRGGMPRWRDRVDNEAPGHLILALQCFSELRNVREVEEEFLAALNLLWDATLRLPVTEFSSDNGEAFGNELRANVLPTVHGSRLPRSALERCRELLQNELGQLRPSDLVWPLGDLLAGWIATESSGRAFLEVEGAGNENFNVRRAALETLARSWPDGKTRSLLIQRTSKDDHFVVRVTSLAALTRTWPDGKTRSLLIQLTRNDELPFVRNFARQTLAKTWPNDQTRNLIVQQADDANPYTRKGVLETLAVMWPDDQTKSLLVQRANEDEEEFVRRSALEALASAWPDEQTRNLLVQRAINDANKYVRRSALETLASAWPGEQTRSLLVQRAINDDSDYVRSTALEGLAKGRVEHRALALLSLGLDGLDEFLDPRQPIPEWHLEDGAEELGLGLPEVRQILESCEVILGWNPLLGTHPRADGPEGPPAKE